ncbi:hypothetical protein J2S58_001448 [Nakamurella flavida]|nr:hypothetical protein [Nakamurella flavida]
MHFFLVVVRVGVAPWRVRRRSGSELPGVDGVLSVFGVPTGPERRPSAVRMDRWRDPSR